MKNNNEPTNYTGSSKTAKKVYAQIAKRFGTCEAKKYDPLTNCRTFNDWRKNGFKVKRGEKSLKSFIFYTTKDKKGNELKKMRTINLFYVLQVEPLI